MSTSLSAKPKIENIKDHSAFHQRITLGPFERGYGHTLGNALRRVLLSSIPGFAPTEVSIEDIEHQYSTIHGVAEDVIEILLNLKGVAFRITGSDRAEVSLDVTGPRSVTAADIKLPGQVEVMNPEHHIATLAQGAKLAMKIKVEGGKGYRPAASAERSKKAYGAIQLDASFSPVINVGIDVVGARVESRTDLDNLVIDLKTNGVHDPEQMIRYAAKLLIDQLDVLAQLDSAASDIAHIGTRAQEVTQSHFYEALDTLELNVRYINNLKQENIFYIGELVRMSEAELMKLPRLGRKSVDEVKLALAKLDLELGMDVGNFDSDAAPAK